MLVREAAIRSLKELFLMFYYLLRSPLRLESRMGFFKTALTFFVACYLMMSVLILPFFDNFFFKSNENKIYLNILEPPQYARNASYLCEFKVSSTDTSILTYNQSYDGREISISTTHGDFRKANCQQYPPGYLFNDYDVKGTIINVFYAGNMNTTLNHTDDWSESIKISSDMPMRMFVRNKKAVLLQQNPYSATLVKGIAHLDHSVKQVFSLERNYLNYSRSFVFRGMDRYQTVHYPRVLAYDLPLLNEFDATTLATFKYEPQFSVNLHMPKKRAGESIQAFFKIEGQIIGQGLNNFQIAAYDFIDTNNLAYFHKYWTFSKPFIIGLSILYLTFFMLNLYTLKSGTKLSDVTYNKPHVDDVIRQSAKPEMFTAAGYPRFKNE